MTPSPRLRVIARDPHALYVYWDGIAAPAGTPWELRAEGPDGAILATVQTDHLESWLPVVVASVVRVSVRPRGAANATLSALVSGEVSPLAPAPLPSSASWIAAS